MFSNARTASGQIQSKAQYQGVYGAKKKLFGSNKKKYKHIKKKNTKKRLQKKSKQFHKRKKYLRKRNKRGFNNKKKSLYGHKKKRGKYPRSRAEMGTQFAGVLFSGVAVSQNAPSPNAESQYVENVFANYKPAPSIGLGAYYYLSNQLSIGLKMEAIPFNGNDFKIKSFNVGLNLKYNLTSQRSTFSPYVGLGLNYTFANIYQSGRLDRKYVGEDFSNDQHVEKDSHVSVIEIDERLPEIQTGIIPMFGYELFVGTDIKLNNNVGVSLQLEYHSSIAQNNKTIKKYYPNNTSNFNFIGFSAGLKFNLIKNKSLY